MLNYLNNLKHKEFKMNITMQRRAEIAFDLLDAMEQKNYNAL